MNTDKLIKISSITKKLLVALFGTFLLVFLLFHMSANLLILAKDGGDAYSAFCHFMGSNIIVKIAEIALFGTFFLHMCISVWLWWQNRKNRPVRYHQPSRTKTAKGSKLAIVTGSLLLLCIIFHFYDFYFVKMNFVEGTYMVKTTELAKAALLDDTPNPTNVDYEQVIEKYLKGSNGVSSDMKWIRGISAEDKEMLQEAFPKAVFEPDFYNMARQKFSNWHIVLGYLVFFFLVGLHIRHGFESAFQTFGLNHYKYSKLIEVLGIIYCWIVCLGFAIVPICVFLFNV